MANKHIKFTAEDAGAIDGIHVQRFKIGEVYELPAWFADKFVEENKTAVVVKVKGGDGEKEPERETKEATPVKEKKKG